MVLRNVYAYKGNGGPIFHFSNVKRSHVLVLGYVRRTQCACFVSVTRCFLPRSKNEKYEAPLLKINWI